MTDQNNQDPTNSNNSGTEIKPDKPPVADDDIVEKLVKERVEQALKPIKEKLDNAFSARDQALEKIAAYEKEKREAEIARLEEEGKHKEAYEKRLAEERAAREVLEKQNIELTRDSQVRSALTGIGQEFRNEKAVEMAFQEVVKQLVRDEQGQWVHRSGVSIKDFIKVFAETEDNSFLFKVKPSSGSGSGSPTNASGGNKQNKSLFDIPQNEVLKMAAEGKLPPKRG